MKEKITPVDFNELGQFISLVESELFTGSFSENTIHADLQLRRNKDVLNQWQTSALSDKKRIYIQELNKWLDGTNKVLNLVQTHQSWDSELIARCERCKNQANTLLNIVRSFR